MFSAVIWSRLEIGHIFTIELGRTGRGERIGNGTIARALECSQNVSATIEKFVLTEYSTCSSNFTSRN